MSFIRRPLNWLCLAAFAAAFWITFRVMAASAPASIGADLGPTAFDQMPSSSLDVQDPALERMISTWAEASASARQ